ncbi:Uncharacterised protein [Mycobacterium tuberculosis]|uniref:Uncharacterized protein n=1 Tax=Mycobacterium tuberculosis TaxID=1773 RepID=A0A655JTM5_MYCTX|nr:Uncharacterised protein [Mycobacterium tuberculosis]CNU56346.1 Uncharacterised protein [Mycobacterium tuberculosis]COX86912.1 Uncharacterised protein [Mycobacterium tuberculosis]SGM19797.1 Uncharacterised protein [Mycobacterium tuberculosis]
MPAVQQGGHQVGAHEARAAGDQNAAELGCQRCITHAAKHNLALAVLGLVAGQHIGHPLACTS